MITEIEHKRIFEIIEKSGSENKTELRSNIIELLKYKESNIKNQFKRLSFDFVEQIKEL